MCVAGRVCMVTRCVAADGVGWRVVANVVTRVAELERLHGEVSEQLVAVTAERDTAVGERDSMQASLAEAEARVSSLEAVASESTNALEAARREREAAVAGQREAEATVASLEARVAELIEGQDEASSALETKCVVVVVLVCGRQGVYGDAVYGDACVGG